MLDYVIITSLFFPVLHTFHRQSNTVYLTSTAPKAQTLVHTPFTCPFSCQRLSLLTIYFQHRPGFEFVNCQLASLDTGKKQQCLQFFDKKSCVYTIIKTIIWNRNPYMGKKYIITACITGTFSCKENCLT